MAGLSGSRDGPAPSGVPHSPRAPVQSEDPRRPTCCFPAGWNQHPLMGHFPTMTTNGWILWGGCVSTEQCSGVSFLSDSPPLQLSHGEGPFLFSQAVCLVG
ncbi:hypothetical protein BDV29DRAFT_169801 [Aspergillus leporis]|jgi:hypothetical protein|uniref:Uncharacterized protein n=1 Tax=Aspergillus leporis TaxID=41062 RepID=A0A5N5X9A3_9EURO|nr:hypothetical protein BDV29DRAFT_169801 [Aspergillus leporis]